MTAEEIIELLDLRPHPKEGGFFRETYRAAGNIEAKALPERYAGDRSVSTAIYYLLTPSTYSALHRLKSDEVFHFYLGDPVRMLQLSPDGSGRTLVLGSDVLRGQQPQVVVPSGVWQGSLLEPGGRFALLGCTVAPGFDYADYEQGIRSDLTKQYPEFRDWIERLAP
ncbi:MAG: cupin domain-containing protein [Gemmataceae bacterium]|nr:cupin domain-containing protein [Gemmataceae bacterium]MCI0738637.1 cupin domain-containing protein [Gemmataceae bacterium]